MLRFGLISVACLVSAVFIFTVAMIGTAAFPFVPLMLFTSVGWMHIAQDFADWSQNSAKARASSSSSSVPSVSRGSQPSFAKSAAA